MLKFGSASQLPFPIKHAAEMKTPSYWIPGGSLLGLASGALAFPDLGRVAD